MVKSEPIPGYAYNDENISVTWEKSSLRKFLNSDFIDETFSESQKSKILETRISIPLNSQSKTKVERKQQISCSCLMLSRQTDMKKS